MTRELADWIKSITWPLATWTGSSLIGSNQSRDLLPLNQGASWLDQFNHLACFLRGLFQNLWKSTRCKKILQTFVLFQYIVGGNAKHFHTTFTSSRQYLQHCSIYFHSLFLSFSLPVLSYSVSLFNTLFLSFSLPVLSCPAFLFHFLFFLIHFLSCPALCL